MTVDFDAAYTVRGYPGVAFRLAGFATEQVWPEPELACLDAGDPDHEHDDACYIWPEEPDTVAREDQVRAVMVGDDAVHIIDTSDLTPLPEDGFCRGCGQTGCHHEVWS